jgi:hypothetical protein
MKFYSLNWVQFSYDFGEVIPNGTTKDIFALIDGLRLSSFFSLFASSWVIIMLISFRTKFWLVHIYMVYNDAIDVKQLGIYGYLILVTLFR